MGLHFLGLVRIGAMFREKRLEVQKPAGLWSAYLMGLAFAFGWTPCIGPVLGTILTMSATTGALGQGVALLAVYALGLGVPFLLAALFTDGLLRQLKRLSRTGRALQRGAGALLVVMGALMLTGRLETLAYWLRETFPALARSG